VGSLDGIQEDACNQISAEHKEQVDAHPSGLTEESQPAEDSTCRVTMVEKDEKDSASAKAIQLRKTGALQGFGSGPFREPDIGQQCTIICSSWSLN
jgi:hypothetical protein